MSHLTQALPGMAMMFRGSHIKFLERHDDDRGWLLEMYRSDEIPNQEFRLPEMGYVSMTKPGVARGPHEHTHQSDLFVFIGPSVFEISLWDRRKAESTYGQKQVFFSSPEHPFWLIVPPGIVHSYKNVGTEPGLVYNFPNALYRGRGKREPVDEIRYEDMQHPLFSGCLLSSRIPGIA